MDYALTETQRIFRESLVRFLEREVAPLEEECDRHEEFPVEMFRRFGERGYLCVAFPEAYGGAGADAVTLLIFCEEIGRLCAGIGGGLLVQSSLATTSILHAGSEDQKQKFLPPAIRGEKIFAFALTEPGAGSDAASIKTRAVRDGDDYVINGSKMFITNYSLADYITLAVVTDPEKGRDGISLLVVEKGAPGLEYGRNISKLGNRATQTGELIFNDCRAPAANRIGAEGAGFRIIMRTLDEARLTLGAKALGIAQAAFDESLQYAKDRVQFGKPIGKFQMIQSKLAWMATQLEAARLLLYKGAWLKDHGDDYSKQAAMAKLYATETAVTVTGEAMQIHGGYGYTTEFPVQRHFRDAKLLTIGEGTSEIQQIIIAKQLGL
jgi:alkylation response protein AidB-like acyl-CoA dehydrogenase